MKLTFRVNNESELSGGVSGSVLTLQTGESSGNGFFVHFPGAQDDIILIAGHDLIDSAKRRYNVMTVHIAEPHSGRVVRRSVPPDAIRTCEQYADNPSEASAQHDYGVILLAREPGKAPRYAFGFCLHLGHEERLDCDVGVTGFQQGKDGPAGTSTGACVNPILSENQLESWRRRSRASAGRLFGLDTRALRPPQQSSELSSLR